MLIDLCEKIKIFWESGYNEEDMEDLVKDMLYSEDVNINDIKIGDLFEALDNEQSYWD